MEVCKFRVLLDNDTDKDVFRDIEILEDQSYLEFHECIQAAFGFSGREMASFYVSNDNWDRGAEIALMDMGFDPNAAPALMANTEISTFLLENNQKFVYVYDFLHMWCFYVELIERSEYDDDIAYPSVAMSFGDAPEEGSDADDDFGFDLSLDDDDDDDDDDNPKSIDDEIGDMFDDYEDYV